jgi:hemolysin D
MNGHNGHNGKTKIKQKVDILPVMTASNSEEPAQPLVAASSFDQPVLLQQSPIWSRAIVWGIMGVTTGLVIWACVAKIEEAIPAQGQLEPIGTVKPVQAPVGGVVKKVYVEDGTRVKQGDLLVSLEPTVPQAQLTSLTKIRTALLEENQFYRTQMRQPQDLSISAAQIAEANLKPELVSLTKSRSALVDENQLYRAELNNLGSNNLNNAQKQRLQSSLAELNSRIATAELEVTQIQKQLSENRVKRAGAQKLLLGSLDLLNDIKYRSQSQVLQLEKQLKQNRVKRNSSQKNLSINQGILRDLKPVAEAGALARVQLLRQEQEVTSRQSDVDELDQEYSRLQSAKVEALANSQVEFKRQQEQVNTHQTEINQLDEEYKRLNFGIEQGQEKLKNTVALSKNDLLSKIADNEKRIAEIDSQLTKAIVENEKKVAEIDSQISQAKLTLNYQELRSPVSGTVFDLQAHAPGFVTNNNEPILKIVPNDNLVAKVFITNKDIGFVKEGMNVDVRVDSFPFSEFGDIKGRLEWIGSDALPPDQSHPYYRFPAKVHLDKQFLTINDRQVILQSGMSVNANLKVRSRTVMSIFTDLFGKNVDSLKSIR